MKKKLMSLILALALVLGTLTPGLAQVSAGPRVPQEAGEQTENQTLGDGLEISPIIPPGNVGLPKPGEQEAGHGEVRIVANVVGKGINNKDFDFAKIYPDGITITFYEVNDETFEESTRNGRDNLTANGSKVNALGEYNLGIFKQYNSSEMVEELPSTKAKVFNPSFDFGKGGHLGVKTYTLILTELKNPKVRVETKDLAGSVVANPTGTYGLSIGSVSKANLEIPAKGAIDSPFENAKDEYNMNTEIEALNSGTITASVGENNFLKSGTTYYKASSNVTEGTDSEGLNIQEVDIKLQEIKNVVPQTGADKPPVPASYVKVDFAVATGDEEKGSIDAGQTTVYWVNPEVEVTLTAPTVTEKGIYTHDVDTGWSSPLKATFNQATTINPVFNKKILVIEDPETQTPKEGYVRVTFNKGLNGTLSIGNTINIETKEYDVLAGISLADAKANGLVVPTIVAETGYKVAQANGGWDKDLAQTFVANGDYSYTAQYEELPIVSDENHPGYHKIEFHPGNEGTFEKINGKDQVTVFYVKPGTSWKEARYFIAQANNLVMPTASPKIGYEIETVLDTATNEKIAKWSPNFEDAYIIERDHNLTAQYIVIDDVIEIKDGVIKPEGYVTVEFAIDTADNNKGKFAEGEVKSYYVNPTKDVVLSEPSIVETKPYIHTGWDQNPTAEGEADKYVKGVARKYTKDMTLTAIFEDSRDIIPGDETRPAGFITISFKEGQNGNFGKEVTKGQKSLHVRANKVLTIPAPEIVANTGFKFTGWDKPLEDQTYTVEQDPVTITAQYEAYDDVIPGKDPNTGKDTTKPEGYVTIEFKAVEGQARLTGESLYYVNPLKVKTLADATDIKEPTIIPETGFKVADQKWNPDFAPTTTIVASTDPMTFTASTEKLSSVIPSIDPETKQPNEKPEGYITVTFSAGDHGKFNQDVTEGDYTFYINPNEKVTLQTKGDNLKAKITPSIGWTFASWDIDIAVERQYKEDRTIRANYTEGKDVIPGSEIIKPDDIPAGYITVTFKTDTTKGEFVSGAETTYYVNPNKYVTLTAPVIEEKLGYRHSGWDQDPTQARKYNDTNNTINAEYETLADIIEGGEKPKGYVEVTLNAVDGKFKDGSATKSLWVKPGTKTERFEQPVANDTKQEFEGWQNDPGTITGTETVTLNAQYKSKAFDEKNIASIKPNMPTKTVYKENENFEEAGMTVVLTDINGNTKTVTAENFTKECITVEPANGDKLTVAKDNAKPVKVVKEYVQENGLTAKVTGTTDENLTVNPADKMKTPTINPGPINGDTKIEGSGADAGATIVVKLPNKQTITTKADDTGNWSVDTPRLNENDEIVVHAEDPEGKKTKSDDVPVTVGKATSNKDVVPYEPADPTKPTDENDKNIPTVDKDGNKVVKENYVKVAFTVTPEIAGTLTLDNIENQATISALVKKDVLWENVAMPTTNPTADYIFYKWTKGDVKPSGQVQEGDIVTANFITSGDEIDKDFKLPQGWFKVRVDKSTGITDNPLFGKTYAVKSGDTLAEAKFPKLTAAENYKDPKWNVENPWTVAIREEKTFTATASSSVFDKKAIDTITFDKDPTKMTYTEGEKLKLAGLEITLTDDKGNKVTIDQTQLAEYGVTVRPSDGVTANVDGHNNTKFTATVPGKTGPLTADSPSTIGVNHAEKPESVKPGNPEQEYILITDPVDETIILKEEQIITGDANGAAKGTPVKLVDLNGDPITDVRGREITGQVDGNGKYLVDITGLTDRDKEKLNNQEVFVEMTEANKLPSKTDQGLVLDLKGPEAKDTKAVEEGTVTTVRAKTDPELIETGKEIPLVNENGELIDEAGQLLPEGSEPVMVPELKPSVKVLGPDGQEILDAIDKDGNIKAELEDVIGNVELTLVDRFGNKTVVEIEQGIEEEFYFEVFQPFSRRRSVIINGQIGASYQLEIKRGTKIVLTMESENVGETIVELKFNLRLRKGDTIIVKGTNRDGLTGTVTSTVK